MSNDRQRSDSKKQVVVLSGGVGGAKLVLGLARTLPTEELVVVTNTGDDFDHLGLKICPDTDTVLYTLAELSNTELGWGRADETWTFMQVLRDLGGPEWFNLGDGDLALHALRTEKLKTGVTLSDVIAELAVAMGIHIPILPMSNQAVATMVQTKSGELAFQHYFVRDRCAPEVTGFRFDGIESAQPNPALIASLTNIPSAIIIAPSNPYVSVDPILRVPGMRDLLKQSGAPIIAVSPIVGGSAIKGPAAKMMLELGAAVSAAGIAAHYAGLIDGLIIDEADVAAESQIRDLGIDVLVAPTVMRSLDDRKALANLSVEFADRISRTKNKAQQQ